MDPCFFLPFSTSNFGPLFDLYYFYCCLEKPCFCMSNFLSIVEFFKWCPSCYMQRIVMKALKFKLAWIHQDIPYVNHLPLKAW
jgi:hypothetical protein